MRYAATSSVPVPQARHDHTRDVDPHRQLMAAVLQTALDDCWDSFSPQSAGYGTFPAGRRFRDARVYVLNKDRGWPFSFENLCDALDLDARKLRRAILGAPKAATVRPAGPVTTEQILDWWRGRSPGAEVDGRGTMVLTPQQRAPAAGPGR